MSRSHILWGELRIQNKDHEKTDNTITLFLIVSHVVLLLIYKFSYLIHRSVTQTLPIFNT